MNVYKNPALNLNIDDTVFVAADEKQNCLRYGDILFTGSSETPDECGLSSIVSEEPKEKIYLNSFCFGYRLNDADIFLPDFLKHLFRSNELRKKISKTANGVTRFNISKEKFGKIVIPIPPLPVQTEIVNILDTFNLLEKELEKELEIRTKQYKHYRNKLLSFVDGSNTIQYMSLGEVCDNIFAGDTPNTSRTDFYGGDIPWLRSGEIDFNQIYKTEKTITQLGYESSSAKWIQPRSVLLAMTGATVARSAVNEIKLTANQSVCAIEVNPNLIHYKFLYYVIANKYEEIKGMSQGALTSINLSIIKKIIVPVPSLEEQERIVSILDKFDALVNDISEGLPAEIKARHQQYEYYRNKLLDFKELPNE